MSPNFTQLNLITLKEIGKIYLNIIPIQAVNKAIAEILEETRQKQYYK